VIQTTPEMRDILDKVYELVNYIHDDRSGYDEPDVDGFEYLAGEVERMIDQKTDYIPWFQKKGY
jgi:hypothetical protein